LDWSQQQKYGQNITGDSSPSGVPENVGFFFFPPNIRGKKANNLTI